MPCRVRFGIMKFRTQAGTSALAPIPPPSVCRPRYVYFRATALDTALLAYCSRLMVYPALTVILF